ncbi:MAG: DUF1343 domain-containing protein [Verrucomicrobia bacterium]|nr:DUF1343 domain-containing protein [Verrucomicrobiota bacterium]
MPGLARVLTLPNLLSFLVLSFGLLGCSSTKAPKSAPSKPLFTPPPGLASDASASSTHPVMLGIDVLEAEGFASVRGKRIGLLTHPAGVNRQGIPTIDVLRRAPGVKLVALFAAEHGITGDAPASAKIASGTDNRTGLAVHSLFPPRRPTKAMLKDVDALVIDLQDIGTRSYTFVAAMRWAMEGCFEHNVEVIVLDRPNPLGGLKVGGPLLDAQWSRQNYVGAFRVPYVHGLTIGELARMAKEAPGVLEVPEAVRARGRLKVITMRGWHRAMRWPETGLKFVPTSGMMRDFEAVQGYPMTGLGSYFDSNPRVNFDTGFRTGIGPAHPFRGLSHKRATLEVLEKELVALQPKLPGLRFQRVTTANSKTGKNGTGLYIQIVDYDAWEPCDLNFWMMKLTCRLSGQNPFAPVRGRDPSGFLRHMGSQAFMNDLAANGANVDVEKWLRQWREQSRVYQEQSKRYWLYR